MTQQIKKKPYLKNKDLLREILLSKEQDELTDEAVRMLRLLCKKTVGKLSYKFEEDREDAISNAVMKCVMYWRGFNPERSLNAFGYYTRFAFNGYAESFNKGRLVKKTKTSDIISLSDDNVHIF